MKQKTCMRHTGECLVTAAVSFLRSAPLEAAMEATKANKKPTKRLFALRLQQQAIEEGTKGTSAIIAQKNRAARQMDAQQPQSRLVPHCTPGVSCAQAALLRHASYTPDCKHAHHLQATQCSCRSRKNRLLKFIYNVQRTRPTRRTYTNSKS